jgi:hypothetical protein
LLLFGLIAFQLFLFADLRRKIFKSRNISSVESGLIIAIEERNEGTIFMCLLSSDDASTHINNDNNKCSTKIDNNINTNTKFSADSSKSKKEWFRILKYCYWNLIKNSTIITNSEFTRRAIVDAFGIDQIYVLSPPMMLPPFIIMLH